MTSDRQITANRQNALRSTGPRSLDGKRRSAQNSLKHGLTATHMMLPGENPEEFNELKRAMFSSLNPQGALENQLAERAASLMWRLRRVPVFEAALYQWTAHLKAAVHDPVPDEIVPVSTAGRNDREPDEVVPCDRLTDPLEVGRMMEALLSSDLIGKLTRYETEIQRQLLNIMRELRELAAVRKKSEEVISDASSGASDERQGFGYYDGLDGPIGPP